MSDDFVRKRMNGVRYIRTRAVSMHLNEKMFKCEPPSGSISPTYLHKAFTLADPKSIKRQTSHQCLYVLLGFERVKAARKMLVKSTHV